MSAFLCVCPVIYSSFHLDTGLRVLGWVPMSLLRQPVSPPLGDGE